MKWHIPADPKMSKAAAGRVCVQDQPGPHNEALPLKGKEALSPERILIMGMIPDLSHKAFSPLSAILGICPSTNKFPYYLEW